MTEKLTVQCPYCNSLKIQVTECKDLVFVCPECGASFKVSATGDEAIIKIKKSAVRKRLPPKVQPT